MDTICTPTAALPLRTTTDKNNKKDKPFPYPELDAVNANVSTACAGTLCC